MITLTDLLACAHENASGGWMTSPAAHRARAAERIAASPAPEPVAAELALLSTKSRPFAFALAHGGRTYYGMGEALMARRYPTLNAYLNSFFN